MRHRGSAGGILQAAFSSPHCKPTVIAAAVFAFSAAPCALAQWKPNAEVYVKPGDERSYIGADGVIPLWQTGTSLLFGDLKAKLGENDTHEFNIGLAYRQFTRSEAWAWGGYLAYDRRRARSGNDFNQVTIGAEARSQGWDFRVNYYHPTTDKHLLGVGATSFQDFRVFRNGIYEEAMRGADVEVGALLPFTGKVETRVFLAGYTFKAEDLGTHADGARLRFEARPRQDIILGFSVQHDNLFKTAYFLEARYAFGKAPQQGVRTLADRMTDPWTRDIDVIVTPATESTNMAFVQQQPGMVVHIDSSKPAGGDGSFERPYNLVATCEAEKCGPTGGAYNLVRLWQGNSGATPYTPITLQPGRTLWGQGLDILTNVASPELRPVIAGAANAITLVPGSNFTIAGVDARSTGASGISGTNVFGAISIRDNAIRGATHGIEILNAAAGTATIDISGNGISASALSADGIHLSNMASGLAATQNAVISGNTIAATATGAGGNALGIRLYNRGDAAGTATQNVTVSANTITSRASTAGFMVMGIRAENRSNDDLGAAPGTGTQNVTVTGNTITATNTGTDQSAVGISLVINQAVGAARQTTSLTGNMISAITSFAGGMSTGVLINGNAANQTTTLSGNTISITDGGGAGRVTGTGTVTNLGAGSCTGGGTASCR